MLNISKLQKKIWFFLLFGLAVLFLVPACASKSVQTANVPRERSGIAPDSKPASGLNVREERLKELKAGAKKEGQLDIVVASSFSRETMRKLELLFNNYYGLNIRLNADIMSDKSELAARAVMEAKMGAAPFYDVQMGNDDHMAEMYLAGALEKVAGWQTLLPEGTRPDVSPPLFDGAAFFYHDTWFGFAYNSKLISEKDLPRVLMDLSDPRYRGKFSIRASGGQTFKHAVLTYNADEVRNIARGWGQNKPMNLDTSAALERLGLGEIVIVANTGFHQYLRELEKGMPIAWSFFKDSVPRSREYFGLRKRAKHPDAAALWLLWAGSPDAFYGIREGSRLNSAYPLLSPESANMAKKMKESGANVVDFFNDNSTVEKLRWLTGSPEGNKLSEDITNGLKGR